jgi:hypothetical protein
LDTVAAAYAKDSSMFAKSDSDLAKYLKEDLKIDDDKLVESLVANKEETRDLAEKIKQNNAIIDAQNDLIAS